MNIYIQLAEFLEEMEGLRRSILSCLPMEGYRTTQALCKNCIRWIELEKGPIYTNGYKEYFWNIVGNLKHENSSHLALAVFLKNNSLSDEQLFLLLRLLSKTITDSSAWDNYMGTYLDRGQAIFPKEQLDTLFKGSQETHQVGNVFQYNPHSIMLNRPFVSVKQFLGKLPKEN